MLQEIIENMLKILVVDKGNTVEVDVEIKIAEEKDDV